MSLSMFSCFDHGEPLRDEIWLPRQFLRQLRLRLRKLPHCYVPSLLQRLEAILTTCESSLAAAMEAYQL